MSISIAALILALLSLLLGFIGLVVLIYGFKNNNVSNITKGAVVFSIALILATIMSFMIAKKCVRHYKKQVRSIGILLTEKQNHPHPFMMDFDKKCCDDKEEMKCEGKEMKEMKEDAGKVVITKKIITEKKDDKKVEKKAVK